MNEFDKAIEALKAVGYEETGAGVITYKGGAALWYGWQAVIDTQIRRAEAYNHMIDFMLKRGWRHRANVDYKGYKIVNPAVTDQMFDTWEEAIEACIKMGDAK